MKQSIRSLGVAALLAVTLLANGAAAAEVAGGAVDAGITSKVQTQITAEPLLKGTNVTVTTVGGVVTLKGTLVSPVARVKAVEIAQATEGVTKVVNKVKITTK